MGLIRWGDWGTACALALVLGGVQGIAFLSLPGPQALCSMLAPTSDVFHRPLWLSNRLSPREEQELELGEQGVVGRVWGMGSLLGRQGTRLSRGFLCSHCTGQGHCCPFRPCLLVRELGSLGRIQ